MHARKAKGKFTLKSEFLIFNKIALSFDMIWSVAWLVGRSVVMIGKNKSATIYSKYHLMLEGIMISVASHYVASRSCSLLNVTAGNFQFPSHHFPPSLKNAIVHSLVINLANVCCLVYSLESICLCDDCCTWLQYFLA